MTESIEIQPTGAALGADVRGVDPGDLDEQGVGQIRAALGLHLVLRFRGTELADADYMALGRRFGSYIPPLPLKESEALLDALWAEATRGELTWTQSWQVGDLIIWDNRCTMHRRESFAGHGRRRMHRLMTLGEVPV